MPYHKRSREYKINTHTKTRHLVAGLGWQSFFHIQIEKVLVWIEMVEGKRLAGWEMSKNIDYDNYSILFRNKEITKQNLRIFRINILGFYIFYTCVFFEISKYFREGLHIFMYFLFCLFRIQPITTPLSPCVSTHLNNSSRKTS